MYDAQTVPRHNYIIQGFENDVEMYGAQTNFIGLRSERAFENDVEMYGAQTAPH